MFERYLRKDGTWVSRRIDPEFKPGEVLCVGCHREDNCPLRKFLDTLELMHLAVIVVMECPLHWSPKLVHQKQKS